MSRSIALPDHGLVALTRDSLLALRVALFRDFGPNAAASLQEAGYAGGQRLYDAFADWLAKRGFSEPESLPAMEFGAQAGEFLRTIGWGAIEIGSLGDVATIDAADWAESDAAHPLDFPGCYYSAGMFADLFARLSGESVAAMEVECRSMGAPRCRWLVGTGETMQHVYDQMGQGVAYDDALASA
jgi:predicted hydrocarbon binding protein